MANSIQDILLGIDFGTGGVKVTAVSAAGALLGDASQEYPTEFAHPGWSEQDPREWFPAMCSALKKLCAQGVELGRTAAVSFDGSTHNAVLLDDAMQPLRKTIMWTDQRSSAECAALKAELGDRVFQIAYQQPAPTWTLPQMMWLASHEPQVLKAVRHVLFVKDYVRFLMTGVALTDVIEAQGTLFFDMARQEWSSELAARSGLPLSALPKLVPPTASAGAVTGEAAHLTGIPEGTPVICGTSDSAAEDYGAGAIEPGDCIVKLATAGNVNVMTEAPRPSGRTLTYGHVVPGLWYSVSATNAAALCLRWFRDVFAGQGGDYGALDRCAEASAPGAGGVFFHPYLQGERSPYWDPKLRASFTGVSIATTRGDLVRALYEGVAYSLLDCRGALEAMGLPIRRVFLIGGGAKSRLWGQIVGNVFDRPLQVSAPGDASFGTALIAGAGIGCFPDVKAAVHQCLKVERTLQPDPAQAAFYRRQFLAYRAIHDALAPVYAGK